MRGRCSESERQRNLIRCRSPTRLRIAVRPPHPRYARPLPARGPHAGRGEEKASPFSRRVFQRPSFSGTARNKGPHKSKGRSAGRRMQVVRATLPDVATQACCGRGRAPRTMPLRTSPAYGRARLSALRCGSRRRGYAVDSVQAALHASGRAQELPAPPRALKPSTWLAGRNAGGDDARTARERFARPPAGTALAPPSGSHPECALR